LVAHNPAQRLVATFTAAGVAVASRRANDWYLAPASAATAVLKVRHGVIEEIGIGVKQLTQGRKAQRTFLTSFQ
jgi:hypothetical protein